MKISLFAVILFISSEVAMTSRILFLFPTPSKSHLIVVQGLSTTLARKGHEVTVVSPFPLSKPLKNHRDVVISMNEEATNIAMELVKNKNESFFMKMPKMMRIAGDLGEQVLEHPEFRKIMNEEKFDLVVIGIFFNNFLLGVADHFKCPSILLSVNSAITQTNVLVGNPSAVSSVPNMMFPVRGRMGFVHRVQAFVVYLLENTMIFYFNSKQRQIYE